MIRQAPLVRNGIEKLHSEILIFLRNAQSGRRYSKKLFSEIFHNSVVSHCPALRRHCKLLANEMHAASQVQRDAIVQMANEHNAIFDICSNALIPTLIYGSLDVKLRNSISSLFHYLYDELIQSETYRQFSSESLRDHHRAFRAAYRHQMCPFCGIEDLLDRDPDGDHRDAYDHYLCREHYPFASVNIENLFPICDKCNQRHKGRKNIAVDETTGAPRVALHPSFEPFNLVIRVINPGDLDPQVDIQLTAPQLGFLDQKFATWANVFEIRSRYEGRIREKKARWISEVIASHLHGDVIRDLPSHLTNALASKTASHAATPEKDDHLAIAYLQSCLAHVETIMPAFNGSPAYLNYMHARSNALNAAPSGLGST